MHVDRVHTGRDDGVGDEEDGDKEGLRIGARSGGLPEPGDVKTTRMQCAYMTRQLMQLMYVMHHEFLAGSFSSMRWLRCISVHHDAHWPHSFLPATWAVHQRTRAALRR